MVNEMKNKATGGDLTAEQMRQYEKKGYVILEGIFQADECDDYRQRMIDLEEGRSTLEGFTITPRYHRTMNQHFYDPECESWLVDSRLQKPLEDLAGGKVDGIQTMHFFLGPAVESHQDQYYLPECLAAWIPFEDVSEANGTIYVEPGSHKRRLVTKKDVPKPEEMDYSTHQKEDYFPAVEIVSQENNLEREYVVMNKGDVCFFHGRLIHGGDEPTDPESTRHVLACHYIPYESEEWDRAWPRVSFDGHRRIQYVNGEGELITE